MGLPASTDIGRVMHIVHIILKKAVAERILNQFQKVLT
jgi:hypothetical protein